MIRFGFTYDVNKRCYYTDGHEREDVVKDRVNGFLDPYFFQELRAHRWVQIQESVAVELEKGYDSFPHECSYNFSKGTVKYREYHVDAHNILLEHVDASCLIYGGNLSVRKPINMRPLMIIGQDESTYHQFIFQIDIGKVLQVPISLYQNLRVKS